MKNQPQKGFTLMELMLAMMVASILLVPYLYHQEAKTEEGIDEVAVTEANDIFQSAQNYAAANSGSRPDESGLCPMLLQH